MFGRVCCFFFFQAEDGIRDLVRSRGLGDVYKRQAVRLVFCHALSRIRSKLSVFGLKRYFCSAMAGSEDSRGTADRPVPFDGLLLKNVDRPGVAQA